MTHDHIFVCASKAVCSECDLTRHEIELRKLINDLDKYSPELNSNLVYKEFRLQFLEITKEGATNAATR